MNVCSAFKLFFSRSSHGKKKDDLNALNFREIVVNQESKA